MSYGFYYCPTFSELLIPLLFLGQVLLKRLGKVAILKDSFQVSQGRILSQPTLWLCMFLGMLKVHIYRNYFLHKNPLIEGKGISG